MDFIRIISKRDVNWCEDGYGYGAYCPGPSDPPSYKYCCKFFYLGSSKPSCCQFPVRTGVLIAACISCIIVFTLLLGLYCWFWPTSLLNRKRERNRNFELQNIARDEVIARRNSYKSSVPIY